MKFRLWLTVLVGISVALLTAWPSRSDETGDGTGADEQLAKIKELLEQAIDWYDVLPDAEAKTRLRPQVVMRWRNQVRLQTGAALMAVWTDHGRPAAMASIFQWDDDICHEFGALSRSNRLAARDKTAVIWSPAKSGVDFRDVADVPAPAGNPAARLRQMKAIAERFTARLPKRNGDANHEVLRLLPRPLYRYDLKEADGADPPLQDGGMFAFVMGTDPEVILLLEAVRRGDDAVWQYAFARATAWAAEASLGDEVVWSVSTDTLVRNPTNSQFQIRRPLP
ncbi:MAG: hypothetical protein ACM3U2_11320 [Deltaproteobacteria bacterium]